MEIHSLNYGYGVTTKLGPDERLKTTPVPTHFTDTLVTTIITQKVTTSPTIQFLNGIKSHVDVGM